MSKAKAKAQEEEVAAVEETARSGPMDISALEQSGVSAADCSKLKVALSFVLS